MHQTSPFSFFYAFYTFRATFAKSLLQSFPFAHVWLLAKEIFINLFIHASMSHRFTENCLGSE